jgi:hypothetical protein
MCSSWQVEPKRHGMKSKKAIPPTEHIETLIQVMRGQKVIVDVDLARIYGVETRALNQAVKRNPERFPTDFVFQLTSKETEVWQRLRSQFVTASVKPKSIRSQFVIASKRNLRYVPYAFTEHGAMMAANVLKSKKAVAMSVFVVRAFVKMRELLANNKALANKLAELERKLTSRLDEQEGAILHILDEIKKLMEFPPAEPPRREIGFHVKSSKK